MNDRKYYNHKKNIIQKLKKYYSDEWEITRGLSVPAKMPGFSYSLPNSFCKMGSYLRKVNGSVCNKCYASKGNYSYSQVQQAMHRRLFSLNHPLWVPAMANLITVACAAIKEPFFRWHDSGDLQGEWHLKNLIKLAEMTPDISYWMPSKEYKIVVLYREDFPDNLCVRLSAPMIDMPASENNLPTSTVSSKGIPLTLVSSLCESYKNNNYCGDCRKCWNKNVKDISYRVH